MKRLISLIAIIAISGCMTPPASQEAAISITFKYALAKKIENSDNPSAKAEEIRHVLDDVKSWYKVNETSSLDALKSTLLSRLSSPADRIAADAILTAYVIPSVQQAVKDGITVPASDEQIVVNINKFIGWAYEAVNIF